MSGTVCRVEPASRPLCARIRVPGDKSIAHRAVLFNACAAGRATLTNLPDGADVVSTLRAVEALGCAVERHAGNRVEIGGAGFCFRAPERAIDCGNSGTTMRLLMGVLAGQRFEAVLDGDSSLRRRPMERVARPLRAMGAVIRTTNGRAPVAVAGRELHGHDHSLEVASAQVKTALLLAAMQAEGASAVREPMPTRDHSERMLQAMGIRLDRRDDGLCIEGRQVPTATDVDVCGDASSAAFFVVAACLVPGSDLTVEHVCLNRTRLGFVEILRRMGADIETRVLGESAGEPFGELRVRANELRGTEVLPSEVPFCIDEIPILAVAAAAASGITSVRGAAELRVKESDRIASTAAMLRAFGAEVAEEPDGLTIIGAGPGCRFRGGVSLASDGDHRIAMAAGVGALVATESVGIDGAEAAVISFPGFFEMLAGASRE